MLQYVGVILFYNQYPQPNAALFLQKILHYISSSVFLEFIKLFTTLVVGTEISMQQWLFSTIAWSHDLVIGFS